MHCNVHWEKKFDLFEEKERLKANVGNRHHRGCVFAIERYRSAKRSLNVQFLSLHTKRFWKYVHWTQTVENIFHPCTNDICGLHGCIWIGLIPIVHIHFLYFYFFIFLFFLFLNYRFNFCFGRKLKKIQRKSEILILKFWTKDDIFWSNLRNEFNILE